jgi:hypothetical protein
VVAVEFVRFVVPTWIHRESQAPIGVLGAAYELMRQDTVSHELRSELERWIAWFEKSLPVPDRFNRTRSKGWQHRETRGISWLRTSAVEHVNAMEKLAACVTRCGHATTAVRSQRVGYLVYEDELQVVAEPFRDTPTR